ncbi:extensin family protein [Marinovum sp.]|uniref:extensin-like domain-containing protein n=1 Tax=Marinovum sp. TaxID=2024839 RepID=UPI002B26708B|nr:extensin family protein [Marinovum sp.]
MRLTLIAAVLATPVLAQEDAPARPGPPPETSLTPMLRPGDLGKAAETPEVETPEIEVPAAETAETAPPAMKAPEAETPEAGAPGYVAPDNEISVIDPEPPVPDRIAFDAAALAACHAALDDLGVSYREIDPIAEPEDAGCGIRQPVEVTGLPGGVALEPTGQMRCETALALAQWVQDFALPASEALPERGRLSAIEQGSTYVCRRRNNAPDGKLSEHAVGNGVDIMSFRFAEGPPIPVMPRERDGTMAEAFQDAARATACLHFTTVLGPGSDEAHADHLHLDVLARRGGFRLCQ